MKITFHQVVDNVPCSFSHRARPAELNAVSAEARRLHGQQENNSSISGFLFTWPKDVSVPPHLLRAPFLPSSEDD